MIFNKEIKDFELTLRAGDTRENCVLKYSSSPKNREDVVCDLVDSLIHFFVGYDATDETILKQEIADKLYERDCVDNADDDIIKQCVFSSEKIEEDNDHAEGNELNACELDFLKFVLEKNGFTVKQESKPNVIPFTDKFEKSN